MLGDKGFNQLICHGMLYMTTLSTMNMCLKLNLSGLVGEMTSITLIHQDGELLTMQPSLKTIAFSIETRFIPKMDNWS